MPKRSRVGTFVLLLMLVASGWCLVWHRTDARAWKTPIDYSGDSLLVLARMKSAADGEYWPLLPKRIASLGAPFEANWDPHPTSEDFLYAATGLLARLTGLFPAANLVVLLSHLLAACSFYLCARLLDCRRAWSLVCALAFAWSSYAFFRSLQHVMLAYDWLVPPGLIVCMWLTSGRDGRQRRGAVVFAAAVAFLTGLHNAYYWFLFLQCVALAAVVRLLRAREWRALALPCAIGGAAVLGWLVGNVDSLPFLLTRGLSTSLVRAVSDLNTFALRPALLVTAPPDHRWTWWAHLAAPFRVGDGVANEANDAYAGLLGLAGLAWLIGVSAARLARRPVNWPPPHAWLILWIVLFSMPGGANTLLGTAGFAVFRASNRYSIAIVALALLFLARQMTAVTRRWHASSCAIIALCVGGVVAWDQLPRPKATAELMRTGAEVASDRAFVAALERRILPGGMVFQLPAMEFPEAPPIRSMGSYEPFRPYLFSSHLRFSYGDDKSNVTSGWSREIGLLPPGNMVAALERAGFAAVVIHRSGYADGGAGIVAGLRDAGRAEVIESGAHDLLCVPLAPVAAAERPDAVAWAGPGWYAAEHDSAGRVWRWSRGTADTRLFNVTRGPIVRELNFDMTTLTPRRVRLHQGDLVLADLPLVPGKAAAVRHLRLTLAPGLNIVKWTTDAPPAVPGADDPRNLAFAVYDFRIAR